MSEFQPFPFPEYDGMSSAQLGGEMERLDLLADEQEKVLKESKARLEHLKTYRIPKALEAEGLKNFRLSSGRGVTVENRMFVSCRVENKEALIQWLKDTGSGGLVKEEVNAQTLKAFVKNCIDDGREFPADLVQVAVVPTAKFFK